MKGEVFEILPNGERRSIGKIVSIKQGGLEATNLTEVIVEIGRDSKAAQAMQAAHRATSMGVTCTGTFDLVVGPRRKPYPKKRRNLQ